MTKERNPVLAYDTPNTVKALFGSVQWAWVWLAVRVWLGWQWFTAGWHKLWEPGWMQTGEALRGFWMRAVVIPETGKPPITYDWYRAFLQGLLDGGHHTWFAKLIVYGEVLVGLGLLLGAFTGIAAFFGVLMNFSFLLAGTTSTNPVLLVVGMILIGAWRVAGWYGLDRWLLYELGTPWQKGRLFTRDEEAIQEGMA